MHLLLLIRSRLTGIILFDSAMQRSAQRPTSNEKNQSVKGEAKRERERYVTKPTADRSWGEINENNGLPDVFLRSNKFIKIESMVLQNGDYPYYNVTFSDFAKKKQTLVCYRNDMINLGEILDRDVEIEFLERCLLATKDKN